MSSPLLKRPLLSRSLQSCSFILVRRPSCSCIQDEYAPRIPHSACATPAVARERGRTRRVIVIVLVQHRGAVAQGGFRGCRCSAHGVFGLLGWVGSVSLLLLLGPAQAAGVAQRLWPARPLSPFRRVQCSWFELVSSPGLRGARGAVNLPQSVQTYSSVVFNFFFFSPGRESRSTGIAMPASPLIRVGLALPVVIPRLRSPSWYRSPVNISIVSACEDPSYRAILSRSESGRLPADAPSRFSLVRAALSALRSD